MKEEQRYVADDGSEFSTRRECELYENRLKNEVKARAFLVARYPEETRAARASITRDLNAIMAYYDWTQENANG